MALILKECNSYLIEEEKPTNCFEFFVDYVSSGYEGLCITRTNPKKIREKYELKTEILWLTERKSKNENTISSVLETLMYSLSNFIDNKDKSMIMIDGIEYLISNNEFQPVLNFIRQIVDEISEKNAILLIPVSPLTMKNQELKMLERELEKITFENKENDRKTTKQLVESQKRVETKKMNKKTNEKKKKEITDKVTDSIINEKSSLKIKCQYCKNIFDIKSKERPLLIKCQKCGRKYMIIKKPSISQKNKIKPLKKTIHCIYCEKRFQIKSEISTIKCPSCNKFLIID